MRISGPHGPRSPRVRVGVRGRLLQAVGAPRRGFPKPVCQVYRGAATNARSTKKSPEKEGSGVGGLGPCYPSTGGVWALFTPLPVLRLDDPGDNVLDSSIAMMGLLRVAGVRTGFNGVGRHDEDDGNRQRVLRQCHSSGQSRTPARWQVDLGVGRAAGDRLPAAERGDRDRRRPAVQPRSGLVGPLGHPRLRRAAARRSGVPGRGAR